MTEAELAVAADENLASTWAMLGRSMGADVIEEGPLTMVATGLPVAFFNGAYVRSTTDEPAGAIEDAIRFFAERDLPWLLWARREVAPNLLAAGRAAGLGEAGGPPAMALREIHDRPAMPDGLTVEAARTTRALHQHQALLSEGFGMPMEIAERLIRPPMLEEEHAVVFIGHVDGQPVSCSLLATSAKTAGVYNVATPERFRGRGYGEALTWSAIEEGARRGCSHAALQASDAGYPLYRRMGFVDLGRYVQLAGPPPADRSV